MYIAFKFANNRAHVFMDIKLVVKIFLTNGGIQARVAEPVRNTILS